MRRLARIKRFDTNGLRMGTSRARSIRPIGSIQRPKTGRIDRKLPRIRI
jgi:hypothetical protein